MDTTETQSQGGYAALHGNQGSVQSLQSGTDVRPSREAAAPAALTNQSVLSALRESMASKMATDRIVTQHLSTLHQLQDDAGSRALCEMLREWAVPAKDKELWEGSCNGRLSDSAPNQRTQRRIRDAATRRARGVLEGIDRMARLRIAGQPLRQLEEAPRAVIPRGGTRGAESSVATLMASVDASAGWSKEEEEDDAEGSPRVGMVMRTA